MRYTMYPPKRSLLKRQRTRRAPSIFSCQIPVAASTMCAQSVRRDLRTSGSTPCKNGYGLTRSWLVTEHITPHAVPRQQEIESPHQAYHDARQSRCWESEKQRQVLRHQRLEYRRHLCNDMGVFSFSGNEALLVWRGQPTAPRQGIGCQGLSTYL